jgi:transposase
MQTPFQQDDLTMLFICIYCFVDDFHEEVLVMLRPALDRPRQGVPPTKTHNLSVSELVSLALFFQFTGHRSWKDFYKYITTHYQQDFPHLPSYKNFVVSMNTLSPYAVILLTAFCSFFRATTATACPKLADSTRLPVCGPKREFSHKVMNGLAAKSKTTMGWFYGMRLHIVCNSLMEILEYRITPGNVDDRKGLEMIWNYIFGLIIADAGYVGKEFKEKAHALGKEMFTAVRANMKKLMTKTQHAILRLRQVVETVFSVLKTRMGMDTTLPRSPLGYFARYVWCLAAYQLKKYFAHGSVQNITLLA